MRGRVLEHADATALDTNTVILWLRGQGLMALG